MKRIKYTAVNITLTAGQPTVSIPVTPRRGICFAVAFFTYDTLPTQNINLGIETQQGDELVASVDVRDYAKGNSAHFHSYKQVYFESKGDRINVIMNTSPTLGADFSGQLVFIVDIGQES